MRPRGSAPLAPLVEELDALAEAVRRLLVVRAAAGDVSARDLDTLLDVLRAIEDAVTALRYPEPDMSAMPDQDRH
ncbi:MAG: hypothetical protein KJS97_09075 [Alphaproteobacteria bacterium]|nr:hypothetical protein [Alphaproteobacteria bacterium]